MKTDVVNAFALHDLHMLCLSELGEIHAGLACKLIPSVAEWIMDLLADTPAAQVYVYAEAHHATTVKQ